MTPRAPHCTSTSMIAISTIGGISTYFTDTARLASGLHLLVFRYGRSFLLYFYMYILVILVLTSDIVLLFLASSS